jgi:hypothetical protein
MGALSHALAYTGGAAASLSRALDGLEVDVNRMRANISPETVGDEDYLGAAGAFVDRALEAYRRA